MKARILVIDDDPVVRSSCLRVLAGVHEVEIAQTGREGLALLEERSYDAALVDLKLPDVSGMDILRRAPQGFPDVPIVMITGYSTISTAVEAIRLGAFDYLSKPFDPSELEAAVEKALRDRRLRGDYRKLQQAIAGQYHVSRLVGQGAAARRVLAAIEQAAASGAPVLLSGECGTGKELAARAIHFAGPRRDRPFVAVDCPGIAPDRLAGELLGRRRGRPAGQGLLQAADGGSILIDEIADLPADLQVLLRRAMETGQAAPADGGEAAAVDVRFMAATTQDLGELVRRGRFDRALHERFAAAIRLPPLRERREDVPLLARHFLAAACARLHKEIDDFTPEAMDALARHDWPGNVRELSNMIERLAILCEAPEITLSLLRESMAVTAAAGDVPATAEQLNEARRKCRDQAVAAVEKAFLIEALRRNEYNVTKAAEQTGMQRPNFQTLLGKHGLRIRDIAARENGSPEA